MVEGRRGTREVEEQEQGKAMRFIIIPNLSEGSRWKKELGLAGSKTKPWLKSQSANLRDASYNARKKLDKHLSPSAKNKKEQHVAMKRAADARAGRKVYGKRIGNPKPFSPHYGDFNKAVARANIKRAGSLRRGEKQKQR